MPRLHPWIGGKVPGTGRDTPAVQDTLLDAKMIPCLRGSHQVECQAGMQSLFFSQLSERNC
ncbi:MAG: hypothetical protein APR55_10980 [Methanolinea sp. SDB]|nr:MAG: hypothetical protein APR55_10980 [Methanolinea sp. SDB]